MRDIHLFQINQMKLVSTNFADTQFVSTEGFISPY